MSSDPYAPTFSPAYDIPARPIADEGMTPRPQYFGSLNYFFEHPDWATSLIFGSLGLLIPVIGNILLFGYRYEVVEMKARFPAHVYPKFEFARFSQYLSRGLMPFLVDFPIQFIINIPLQMSIWAGIALVAVAGESQSRLMVAVAGMGIPLIIAFDIAFLLALQTVLVPLMIRAGLTQDFGQTFNFKWIKDFLLKMGLQTLLFNLFLVAVGAVLIFPGYFMCCIGIIPVAFFLMGPVLAHHHGQLYRMYLAKGGEPIPLKPLQLEKVGQASSLPSKAI